MTVAEFDRLTAWGHERWPPFDWDEVTPYMLHEGVMCVHGRVFRAYLFSDGTRLLNHEDLADAAYAERLQRAVR